MPTDNIIDNLYFFDVETGEKHKIGHLENVELTPTETQESEKNINLNTSESFSVTIDVKRSLVYQLDVRIGHKFRVPNNWLKRHKFPMNRKGEHR